MPTDGTSAINSTVILIFFALAVIAATVIMLIGKILMGKWYSWIILLGSAILGGMCGVVIIWFGAEFQTVRSDKNPDSIGTMLKMAGILLLVLMITLPLCSIVLQHRRKKILELEKEIISLKNNSSSKTTAQSN